MNSTRNIELSNDQRKIWKSDDKLTVKDIQDIYTEYLNSKEFNLLNEYDNYYESENTEISDKVENKRERGRTPNNLVPTAYYSTIVDTMAGFMFADVQYNPKTPQDTKFATSLNEILEDNNKEVKEMSVGTHSLAYNKGVELVYTTGDGTSEFEIKYTPIDPRQAIVLYTNDIEPEVYCMIWIRVKDNSGTRTTYLIDVVYKDLWQYFETDEEGEVKPREFDGVVEKELKFPECPVVVYNANMMSIRSPFHKIIRYINALDYLITGNANDIESLTNAILVLSTVLKEKDLHHLDELYTIMGVDREKDIVPQFITKEMDPAFREYASKLLIREIHKHSHTVDYFSPDTGMTGEVSGKALRIRLFDMNVYSEKIEKIYRLGSEKKVRLLSFLMGLKDYNGGIEIVFNRTIPDEFEEIAPVLNQLTFLSDATKLEMLKFDAEAELEKLNEQKEANMEMFDLDMGDGADNETTDSQSEEGEE